MGVNKYAGTFGMASFSKKMCNHRKNRSVEKKRNCFCKYAIKDNQVV